MTIIKNCNTIKNNFSEEFIAILSEKIKERVLSAGEQLNAVLEQDDGCLYYINKGEMINYVNIGDGKKNEIKKTIKKYEVNLTK